MGRVEVDHSSASKLYEDTWLLAADLKYAMLPHTVTEPLIIATGTVLHVFQLSVYLSVVPSAVAKTGLTLLVIVVCLRASC